MFTKNNKGPDGSPTETTVAPAQAAIRSASSKPAGRTAPSIISADMMIKGSVSSDGEMQIDGTIDGDVSAASLTIGTSGKIIGEVRAETVVIRGHIEGAVRARKVELESGARVHGDIVHASLSIQSNAVFEGQVKHSDDPLKTSAPVAASSDTTMSSATNAFSGKPS